MSFQNRADVHCYVDITPFEFSTYSFTTDTSSKKSYSGILSCTVSKNIRNPASGTFTIVLSPGGPKGVQTGPSWAEIITVMSFTTIGMRRGDDAAVVMIGVVTNVAETQLWEGDTVRRTITITGHDMSYFFTMRNYYNLTFLGSPVISALDPNTNTNALLDSINPGLIYGPPDQIADTWWNKMMIPILNLSFYTGSVSTKGSTQEISTPFKNLFSYFFAQYDTATTLPFGANFLSTQSTWFEKFMSFFPFPYYECFVQTVSNTVMNTIYNQSGQTSLYNQTASYPINSVAGFDFTETASGGSSVGLIGRILPFPVTTYDTTLQPTSVNTSYWDALLVNNTFFDYLPPSDSFIESAINYKSDEVSNFYAIQPTQFTSLFGFSPSVTTAVIIFPFAANLYSINRYGWRPNISGIEWFYTSQDSLTTVKNASSWAPMGYNLLSRLTSYHEPTPVMAYASYKHVLMPSVFPGTRFQYKPFRSIDPGYPSGNYDFYVEGITHHFVYGGRSNTTLDLSRGVPTEIWQSDPQGDPLALLTGQFGRSEGTYDTYIPNKNVSQSYSYLQYYLFSQSQQFANGSSTVYQNKKQ